MSQYFKTDPAGPVPPTSVQRGPHRSGVAVASMVLGILSMPLALCIGPLFAAISIILGSIALVTVKKSNGMVSGKGFALTGIILSVLSLSLFAGLMLLKPLSLGKSNETKTEYRSRQHQASLNIIGSSDGEIGYGNTSEAKALADKFAAKMKLLRESLFTSSKKGISVSKGNFLTHCELHDKSCVFLVHIPKLRKFDRESKKNLCDLAWLVAQGTLNDSGFPEGAKLAVGVRGVILYEQIMVGEFHKDLETSRKSIVSRNSNDDVLGEFFPEPLEKPKPAPPITDQEKPNSPEKVNPSKP